MTQMKESIVKAEELYLISRRGFEQFETAVNDTLKASELLERFVDLYGETPLEGAMIAPGHKLWREYYEYSGQHMILTDEGWEPGEWKASYIAEDATWTPTDEVNAPTSSDAPDGQKAPRVSSPSGT